MSSNRINLIVLRSTDLDRAEKFYNAIGLTFDRHAHGSGPVHLACELDGMVFEIYPQSENKQCTEAARIGVSVDDVDAMANRLIELGANVKRPPKDSPWGRRAIVLDFDGHTVELTEA